MYKEVIQLFVDIGLLDVILPFVLVFTITYAILQKMKPLGKEAKAIHAMIAFVLGFTATAITIQFGIINILMKNIAIALLATISLGMVITLAGGDYKSKLMQIITIALFVIAALVSFKEARIIDQKIFENLILASIVLISLGTTIYLVFRKKTQTPSGQTPTGQTPQSTQQPTQTPQQTPSGQTPARQTPQRVAEFDKEQLSKGGVIYKEK